jgi:hypothetical protein
MQSNPFLLPWFSGGMQVRSSPLRSSFVMAHSWRLIIIWLEVRVLPAPPHSLVGTEIFSLSANSPRTGAIRARILSLRPVDWIYGALSAPLSLPRKIAFPDCGGLALVETRFECWISGVESRASRAARGCSNFNNLRKAAAAGSDHFRIFQWSVLLWTGDVGEQF